MQFGIVFLVSLLFKQLKKAMISNNTFYSNNSFYFFWKDERDCRVVI